MINKTLQTTKELISKLSELQKRGFVFRGHSSGKYRLEPSAFRKDILKKLAKIFPANDISKNWRNSNEINSIINLWTKGRRPKNLSNIFDYICESKVGNE